VEKSGMYFWGKKVVQASHVRALGFNQSERFVYGEMKGEGGAKEKAFTLFSTCRPTYTTIRKMKNSFIKL